MVLVSGDKTYRFTCEGNFEKWFIFGVRERIVQRRRRYCPPAIHNIVKKGIYLFFRKPELRPAQDFIIFRKNTGIKRKF